MVDNATANPSRLTLRSLSDEDDTEVGRRSYKSKRATTRAWSGDRGGERVNTSLSVACCCVVEVPFIVRPWGFFLGVRYKGKKG